MPLNHPPRRRGDGDEEAKAKTDIVDFDTACARQLGAIALAGEATSGPEAALD
jgi:hypothetical protein